MKKPFLVLIAAMSLTQCAKKDVDRAPLRDTSKARPRTEKLYNAGVQKLPAFEPGVILVKFKDNNNQRSVSKVAMSNAKYRHNEAMKKANQHGYYKLPVKFDIISEVVRLRNSPDILWAEPNWSVHLPDVWESEGEVKPQAHTQTLAVNDPFYNPEQQWGSFKINQPALLEKGNFGSQSVVCQVIDEPCLACHEDLRGQIYINPNEIPGDGIDNDNNGFIDDVNGWNFVNNTPIIYMGSTLSHCTHVVGTILAKINNGLGIAGVSPHATVLITPFLGVGGGWIDNASSALDYGTMMRQRGVNVRLSANSWGGGSPSFAFEEALTRSENAGIGFNCAAGNNGSDNDLLDFWPASYAKTHPMVEVVVASDGTNSRASFSNYGKTSTHIAAPGVSILSTIPSSTNTSAYGYKSGTSMAQPHVAGAFCLLFAIHPEWTFLQAKTALNNAATPVPALANYCSSGGVLDLNNPIFWGVTPAVQPDRDCFPVPVNDVKPTVPQNFRFTSTLPYGIGPDGLAYMNMTWDLSTHPDGIADYAIQLTPNEEWVTFGPSGLTGRVVRDYDMYIRARSVFGIYSDTSIHLRVTEAQLRGVPGDTNPPTVPQNFDIYDKGIDANGAWAKMRWDWSTDPEGSPIWYDIWMVRGNEAPNHIGSVSGTNLVTVNGLQINKYKFWTVARDSWNNKSAPSNGDTVSFVTTPPPPPPPTCTINTSLIGAASGPLQATLTFSASSDCTIASKNLERKKGGEAFSSIANNPTSPYTDNLPNPGNYTYRLKVVLSNGQVGYSAEKTVKVNKK